LANTAKIAIYTGTVPSTTFIERLVQGLAESGFQVYLFGFQNKKIASSKNTHYITYANKIDKLLLLIKYSFLLAIFKSADKKKLDNILLSKKQRIGYLKLKYYPVLYHRPDIFHLQWAKGVEDWMWVRDFGMKLIVSLRGAHINYSPIAAPSLAKKYEVLFPEVDGFHAVSRAIAIEAEKYKAAPNKIQVAYSGLDLKLVPFYFKKEKSNTQLNIISVGRGHWKKGYMYAINSMKLLKDMGIDFHYTIVGIANNEELLYQRAQLELETKVRFISKLPFAEVLELMQEADVLLLPSVEEGIANVVLEAMASGTVVVSTNCGGMAEVIINNENGFLVPIRNSLKMATALESVLAMTLEQYRSVAKAARKTIENQHSQVKMIDDMDTLYHRVLNNKL